MTLRMYLCGSRLADRNSSLKCHFGRSSLNLLTITLRRQTPGINGGSSHPRRLYVHRITSRVIPELTLDSLGPQRSHDDGLGKRLPDFFFGVHRRLDE